MSAAGSPKGWTITFADGAVTQLRIDQRFTLLLGGGALIVIGVPFLLRRGTSEQRVPPGGSDHEVGDALRLFGQVVRVAGTTPDGALIVDFDSGEQIEVPMDPQFEGWEIHGERGEMWVGLPGGGVAHFPSSST